MALVEVSGLHFRLYKRGHDFNSGIGWGTLWDLRSVYQYHRKCVSASLPISTSRTEPRCRQSPGGWAGAAVPRLGLPFSERCTRPVLVRSLPVIGQLVAASTVAAAPAAGGVVVAIVTQLMMTAAVLSYGAYLGEGLLQRDRIKAPPGIREL